MRPAICRRPPKVLRAFNSKPGSVCAARHAGTVPEIRVVNTANSAVIQKIALSGCTDIDSNIIGSRKKCSKKLLPYQAAMAPKPLPAMAITKPSVRY